MVRLDECVRDTQNRTLFVVPYLKSQCDLNALVTSRPVVRFKRVNFVTFAKKSAMTRMNRLPSFVFSKLTHMICRYEVNGGLRLTNGSSAFNGCDANCFELFEDIIRLWMRCQPLSTASGTSAESLRTYESCRGSLSY